MAKRAAIAASVGIGPAVKGWGVRVMVRAFGFMGVLLVVVGCARTEVVPLAKNEALIATRAAPACGEAGALRVASQMAAVTTIRSGYERFLVIGANADSNVRVTQVPGATSYTTGTVTEYGNTARGTYQTQTPTQTIVSGRNSADMRVLMLNPGEPGYERGLDARATLGPDWEEIVHDGVSAC